MQTRWIGLGIFFLVILISVPMMTMLMDRQRPAGHEVAVLQIDDERRIRILGRLLQDHAQAYYYEVWQGEQRVQTEAFFATVRPGATRPLDFQWHAASEGQLIGVVAEHLPEQILILHDFNDNRSWPAQVDGFEEESTWIERGNAMLTEFQQSHPEMQLLDFEGLRPVPAPPERVEQENVEEEVD